MTNNIESPENKNIQENQINTPSLTEELKWRKSARFSSKLLIVVIILSLVFGAFGGALGVLYLSRIPQLAKYLPAAAVPAISGINQKINLTEDSSVIDVVKSASPAVVSVIISKDISKVQQGFGFSPFAPFFGFGDNGQGSSNTPDVQQVGAGSGFFISDDGLILTNKHVVSDTQASYSVITSDGKSYDAQVLSRDPINDLALIKINIKNAPKLTLADSSQLQIGQRVVAIGNSLGEYQNTVTTGIVSGIGRSITAGGNTGSEQLSGVVQTDAAINPGNSGGPLLNIAGQVIGINTAIDQQGQLVGFAIPSNDAARAVASFQKYGKITSPFLGIRYVMITPSLAQSEKLPKDYGALILRGQNMTDFAVLPGSPAEKAGLTENDIILEVNGQKIDQKNTLSSVLKNYNIGDTITLKMYHKSEETMVKVTLGEAK